MIEYYHQNFNGSAYTSRVKQLTKDIERLLVLENIPKLENSMDFLPNKYRNGLSNGLWMILNQLYSTLDKNKENTSSTLQKYLIKTGTNQDQQPKFIDTFAGCGGLSIGLSQSGFSPLLVNEIESKFLESFYFNHNLSLDSYFCGDIKDLVDGSELDHEKYANIDLVVGGPPCQGFSMANRQRILDDPRNSLYKQFLKLLARTKPKFFVMENVKGMMNKTDEIISDFKTTLGDAYSGNIKMVLLNAKDFGVPQNRQRVFVIGTRLTNVDINEVVNKILEKRKSIIPFVLKDALEGLPALYPKTEKNKGGLENDKIGFKFSKREVRVNSFLKSIGGVAEYISNHTNRFNNERDVEIFSRLPQGANSLHPSIRDIMPYASRNHMFKDKYFKLDENQMSKTITSHMKFDCNMYIHPSQPRGLSPREAARIQTFPDDYVFMGPNNIWYAQIGNAVPVKLAKAIGDELIKYLN